MAIDRDLLVRTFLDESNENLVSIEEGLMRLEAHPGDEESLRAVFRGAHTIKGNAASLGFHAVTELAHAFEDVLARLRARTLELGTTLASLLLRAVDALRDAIPRAVEGDADLAPEPAAVRDELRRHAEGSAAEASPAGASPVAAAPPADGAEAAPAAEEGPARTLEGRTLRVDVERLDRMLRLAGEIAIARGRLREMLAGAAGTREALETHGETDRLFLELQDQIMEARLVPLGPVFQRYQRTVRDLSVALGKDVELVVEGDEVEVDMTVVEHLRDPITHMIRNALDHGIEHAEVRALAGKDERGRITLRARREAGSILIQIEDDGGGLDLERIREVAAARGLDVSRLRDAELTNLIFTSGFSTAAAVTSLSGRGVGMEVVRRNVDLLRGTIAVETRRERGTTVSIRVPLTLAIIDGFQVGAGAETYVVPLDAVVECMELPARAEDRGSADGVLNVRGEAVPLLRLGELFGGATPAARENVVVVKHEDRLAGLTVDALLGQSQTVIKPLSKMFRGLRGVAGSTILGNGRVALILDVPALLREATRRQAGRSSAGAEASP